MKLNQNLLWTSLGAVLFWGQLVFADPVSVNPRPKMESMGNAGLAGRGDKDSAILNPASLADVEDGTVQAFPLFVEIPFATGVMSSFLDYNDVRERSGATEEEKRDAFNEFVSEVATTATAMRVNLYPSYTTKYFHVGLMTDLYVNPRLRLGGVSSNQVVELGGSSGTAGLIVGGAYSFFKNTLQVGATIKPLYRVSLTSQQNQTLHDVLKGKNPGNSVSDELFGAEKGSQWGFGVGADLGVKYWVPTFGKKWLEVLQPTVGATYQDIGNTRFIGDYSLPKDIDQSISAGMAIHPSWKFIDSTVGVDLRNINEEQAFMNKLHIGFEVLFWEMLAARGGLGQGYLTGGLGFISRFFEADLFVGAFEAGDAAHIQEVRTIGTRLSASF